MHQPHFNPSGPQQQGGRSARPLYADGARGRGRGPGRGRGSRPEYGGYQQLGDEMNNAGSGNIYRDSHGNRLPTEQIPCRFYNLEVGCKLGSKCKFKHIKDERWQRSSGGRGR
ncbi:hypothetical protein WJX84_002538 [Apatococcus fuscideae]|uniref:C3H1-type domain-containing protein n=1 Tax=Apatococcus fuscideae TaxID=2026836 RepID=A0AAW1SLE8_9CHLO